MTDEPWGIILTPTLHLTRGRDLHPSCGNPDVIRLMDAQRDRNRRAFGQADPSARPLFGPADGRPVCLHCITTHARIAAQMARDANGARAWNEQR